MKVKVRLYTILKKYAHSKLLDDNTVILNQEATLKELTDYLVLPDNLGLIFLVNNIPQGKDYTLQEGDEVKIFSLICGG